MVDFAMAFRLLRTGIGVNARKQCHRFGDVGAGSWCATSSVVVAESAAFRRPEFTGMLPIGGAAAPVSTDCTALLRCRAAGCVRPTAVLFAS